MKWWIARSILTRLVQERILATRTVKRRKTDPILLRHLRKHFGSDPAALPVVEPQAEPHNRPNLHLALEESLKSRGREAQLVGVLARHEHDGPSLIESF